MTDFDKSCINTIRVLSADVVQKANSGHPGAPMGMAPIAHVLWANIMHYNPANPKWINRDRFVLSNGHASALQYVMLHLTGYDEFTMDELKAFRQINSKTPGHPENHVVHGGVEVSTGPLGQGISNAVGFAIAEANLRATFNKPGFDVIDNYTYVFCGDGCLQEGVSAEAGSLAGHLGLDHLIVIYDDNHVTIDGETELSFTEDVLKRYESYGWHTQHVADGNSDPHAVQKAIEAAKSIKGKPHFIKVTTTIGFGSKSEGTEKVHGAPLGAEDIAQVKKKFGFDPAKSFHVPDDVRAHYLKRREVGQQTEAKWNELFAKYKQQFPNEASELIRRFDGRLPQDWAKNLPQFKPEDAAKGTRNYSQVVIQKLAAALPELIGGSADLNPSTLTYMDNSVDFQHKTPHGKNIRYGVREHAMAAVSNGIAAYGGFIPYCSTFFNFIGYAAGAVRLSALSGFGVLYIMTHDSIGLGEDGPTHQPINSLMMLRAEPNFLTIRPADGNETTGAYVMAIENRTRPTCIVLTRQAVPNLRGSTADKVRKGAYVLQDSEGGAPQVVLVGTGSEVSLVVESLPLLKDVRVRIVSMPSWELFREQPLDYQLSVFPEGVPVLAVEAASVVGWHEYAHAVIGMKTFGASAPYKKVFEKYGFTAQNVADKTRALLDFYKGSAAPSLVRRPNF